MKILGLDLGDRHTGVAILDTSVPVSLPLPSIVNNRYFLKYLAGIIAAQSATQIIIGLPLTLAGTDSPQTRKVRQMAEKIQEVTGLPVSLEDERFTTRQASALLRSSTVHPAHHLDSVSAQLILESWWTRQNS